MTTRSRAKTYLSQERSQHFLKWVMKMRCANMGRRKDRCNTVRCRDVPVVEDVVEPEFPVELLERDELPWLDVDEELEAVEEI